MDNTRIGAEVARQWLDEGQAVLIDVREPGEYAAAHIPGAHLVPLSKLCGKALPDCAGKKLIVHCQAGRRGESACEKLKQELAGAEVYNLDGGLNAWEQAGFACTRSGGFFLPIDRQVQVIVGTSVLLGVVLGYLLLPVFLLLAAFFGAGLVFAGLTGFCGLARVLAWMPWNR